MEVSEWLQCCGNDESALDLSLNFSSGPVLGTEFITRDGIVFWTANPIILYSLTSAWQRGTLQAPKYCSHERKAWPPWGLDRPNSAYVSCSGKKFPALIGEAHLDVCKLDRTPRIMGFVLKNKKMPSLFSALDSFYKCQTKICSRFITWWQRGHQTAAIHYSLSYLL